MPRPNAFVFAEPLGHYVEWGSCVLREVVAAHRRPWMEVVELVGRDANAASIEAAIDSVDPILFAGIGHGGESVWTCECQEVYMRACDSRAAKMAGRVVVLNSCLTGRALGPDLVSKGALAYFGSTDIFWFYVGSPPCSDRASRAVFLCELQSVASLMDGRTTGEAHRDRLARYDEEVEYWTTGPGRTHPHAPIIADVLIIDKSIAVMLGRSDVRVTQPIAPVVARPINVALTALPLAFGFTWYQSCR